LWSCEKKINKDEIVNDILNKINKDGKNAMHDKKYNEYLKEDKELLRNIKKHHISR